MLIAVMLAAAPLAPAAAVVVVDAPVRATPAVSALAEDNRLSFGEMAAAVAGLLVVGITMLGRRQRRVVA